MNNISLIPSYQSNIQDLIILNKKINIDECFLGFKLPTDFNSIKYQENINKDLFLNNQKLSYVIYFENIAIGRIVFLKSNQCFNISYWISPDYRKRGIMHYSLSYLISLLKNKVDYFKAIVLSNNLNSEYLLLKIGFIKNNEFFKLSCH